MVSLQKLVWKTENPGPRYLQKYFETCRSANQTASWKQFLIDISINIWSFYKPIFVFKPRSQAYQKSYRHFFLQNLAIFLKNGLKRFNLHKKNGLHDWAKRAFFWVCGSHKYEESFKISHATFNFFFWSPVYPSCLLVNIIFISLS